MGNFKRNNKFDRGRGDDRGFGGRNSERPTMHQAVCSECGKPCEVPFKPTGDKPVYCNDCFRDRGNAGSGGGAGKFGGRNENRSRFGGKEMYRAICDKCGQSCEVPFKPSGGKPIYCDQCFGRGDRNKPAGQPNKQLEMINAKLDQILRLLSPASPVKTEEKKKPVEEAPKKEAKKKPKPKKETKVKTVAKAKPKAKAKKKK